MNVLDPLEALYDAPQGADLPLPPALASLYGRLQFPIHPHRPYVIGNFVTTVDGVVALNDSDQSGGGEISGFNQQDRMVMGLLRTVADAVIVGAGTFRSARQHLWTPEHIYPALADEYQQLRFRLGKSGPPLNVIVTARGAIDMALPVFQSGEVPVLVVTTQEGAQRIREHALPRLVQVEAVQQAGAISARRILEVVSTVRQSDVILLEGGPQLIGDFFAERCLDELFLTLAPQLAGRDNSSERPGLVEGQHFAPEHPVWGTLMGIKRGESHLFLRYAFEDDTNRSTSAKARHTYHDS
jgi:riboflavin biosynthesis pyrimidine reductase